MRNILLRILVDDAEKLTPGSGLLRFSRFWDNESFAQVFSSIWLVLYVKSALVQMKSARTATTCFRETCFRIFCVSPTATLSTRPASVSSFGDFRHASDCASNVKCFCAKLWSKATGKALSGNVRPCYTAFAKRVTTLSSTEVCKTWIVHPGLRRSHPIKARHAEAESCKCNRNRQENTRFLAIAQALESSICPLPISCVPL